MGSEISGAVSGVTTPGASRLQASQLQERSATMQRLHLISADLSLPRPWRSKRVFSKFRQRPVYSTNATNSASNDWRSASRPAPGRRSRTRASSKYSQTSTPSGRKKKQITEVSREKNIGDSRSPWRMPDAGVRECSLTTPPITREQNRAPQDLQQDTYPRGRDTNEAKKCRHHGVADRVIRLTVIYHKPSRHLISSACVPSLLHCGQVVEHRAAPQVGLLLGRNQLEQSNLQLQEQHPCEPLQPSLVQRNGPLVVYRGQCWVFRQRTN